MIYWCPRTFDPSSLLFLASFLRMRCWLLMSSLPRLLLTVAHLLLAPRRHARTAHAGTLCVFPVSQLDACSQRTGVRSKGNASSV